MEQTEDQLEKETFSCSICLNLLKNPVTIPCGHSYCLNCIQTHWDRNYRNDLYSCPQCRQTFTPRPVLIKKTMLVSFIGHLKKTGHRLGTADHCYAGADDVSCDVCTGRKRKAVKSCWVCLVSYCHKHLQPHHDVPRFKKHKLADPSELLHQENICPHHTEVMKIFCRTDGQCICYLCSMDEHKGHDTVSCQAERIERQRKLEVSQQKIQQRIKDKQEDVKVLNQEVCKIRRSANDELAKDDGILNELIRLLEVRKRDVARQIQSQEETEMIRVKELESKLEQEITELRRKDSEMEKLCHTHDHNQFFLQYPSVSRLREDPESSHTHIRPRSYFNDVNAAASNLRDKLQPMLTEEQPNISPSITQAQVLLEPEPTTKAEFFRYSRQITLDPNTANEHLALSEENRRGTLMKVKQKYPDHPDRFSQVWQVLSRESLTGRCYWEVEWRRSVEVAVTYKDIKRKGMSYQCGFAVKDNSWSLFCENQSATFCHNSVQSHVAVPVFSRIGVYLDHTAGILSFYNVSDNTTLIHSVHTTFTQPLYVGLRLGGGLKHFGTGLETTARFPKLY